MKKLTNMILLSLIMSCSKNFIDLKPISAVSVDILYKTDKDFNDALTATYHTLQSQYQRFYILSDVRADDSWQQIFKNNSQSYSDAFVTNSSDGLMKSSWQNYYQIIFRVNTILSKIKDADVTIVKNKDRYIGEAKFLRAFAYFDLIRIFGDVPMVTTPVYIAESYKIGRKNIDSIYKEVIIPDFLDAANKLLPKYTGSDVGRPTKGAALSLLGRVYLTRKDFVNAESTLKEVTSMGYQLLKNYNELFDYTKNEHHSEYIFDIEYEEGIGQGSVFTNAFLPNSTQMFSFYGMGGYGDEQNSPSQTLIDLFDLKDIRKDITVGVKGGFYNKDSVFVKLPTSTSQTYTKKYIVSVAANNDSRANWKVIRYADVLLMYAESLNENNKTDLALEYLNLVRNRAGLEGYSDLTKEDSKQKILLERRLELSFEGVRWFDLLRTGQAYKVMEQYGMQPFMTVFPIPLSQIQLINDPTIFPQNKGYD